MRPHSHVMPPYEAAPLPPGPWRLTEAPRGGHSVDLKLQLGDVAWQVPGARWQPRPTPGRWADARGVPLSIGVIVGWRYPPPAPEAAP